MGKKKQLFWLYTWAADKIPSQSNYFLVITLLHYLVIYELRRRDIIYIYYIYYMCIYIYILYVHLIIKIIYISPYLWALYILISQLGGFLSHMATPKKKHPNFRWIFILNKLSSVFGVPPWLRKPQLLVLNKSLPHHDDLHIGGARPTWQRHQSAGLGEIPEGIHHHFFLWILWMNHNRWI